MDWHARYTQQARWTKNLRAYLFEKAGLRRAQRVLEVGCGTGAILSDLEIPASLHGLDLSRAALAEARVHAPGAILVRADALSLPYADFTFDITFCHFLLLWVRDPLQAAREMARATRPNGFVLALAEPDHTARMDKPDSLAPLGRWQTESLRAQGADVPFGARLAETFARAGIEVLETGTIQRSALSEDRRSERSAAKSKNEVEVEGPRDESSREEWEMEWAVIEADLAASIPGEEIHKMKLLDEQTRARGERILHVPTYFALGRV